MRWNALEALEKAQRRRAICIGDVMLDRFVSGAVSRISPEAPAPVLDRTAETLSPGGAANVGRNAAASGLDVLLLGVVGCDPDAKSLQDALLDTPGVRSEFAADPERRTTVKTRFLSKGRQVLRLDSETVAPIARATENELLASFEAAVTGVDIVLVSDYAKGVVTDTLLEAVLTISRKLGVLVVADPKRGDFARYGSVDVLKPNATELSAALGLPTQTDAQIEAALDAALEAWPAKGVMVTRAEKGLSYRVRGGETRHLRGEAREVFDVSGAGDTSLAALAIGLVGGGGLEAGAELAIVASGLAVGKAGTAVVTSEELRRALGGLPSGAMDLPGLLELVSQWRADGLNVGFTNGCFDILHAGHVRLLQEARAQCDRLVLGLNSDASVKRLKGAERPFNGFDDRAAVLQALRSVDAVVGFDEDTPLELIRAVAPDVLVKGGDYAEKDIIGADFVRKRGGSVFIVPLLEGRSTTSTLERVKKGRGDD